MLQGRKVTLGAALPMLVFAAYCGGLAGTVDAQNWEPVLIGSTGGLFPDGTIDAPFRVAVDPSDQDIVYMGTGVIPTPGEPPPPADGLWKSTDGGDSWSSINEASTGDPNLDFFELTLDTSILDVAVCPADPNVLGVATNPKGFFRSEDAGSTWSWIAGDIVHPGDTGQPGHCSAISHSDQRFDTVDERWAGSTIAFDRTDCDTMYVGVADINAIDIGAGTGDHPGMFKTTNGGTTWSSLNDDLEPRVDAIDCHVLDLTSQSFAPISAEVGPTGDLYLVTTDQEADASIFGKNATTQLRIWTNSGSGAWTQVSNGLNSSQITQTAGFGELVAVSVSAGFLTVAPAGNFFLSSHLGINTKITLGGNDVTYESKGIFASLNTAQWVSRDSGIPVANDGFTDDAQNVVGNPTVNPGNNGIWLAGTALQDGAGADASQVYGTANFGDSWINTRNLFSGLSTSPTGLPEANVFFLEWDAAGQCVFATVTWDFRGDTATVDDGVYRVCL